MNILLLTAVVIGFVLLAGVNMFGGRVVATQTLTTFAWILWATITVGYAVRLVRDLTSKRRERARGPIASAGESIQDLYLGRVIHPAPRRRPDEYSAHGSAFIRADESPLDYPASGKISSQ
ncbi:hypothetical protein [Homoserinimonas sp. A520]